MSMLSRSQRTAFKAEQINDAVVLEPFRFDGIEAGLWILDLTRFLDANRFPPRIKSGAGFRVEAL